MATQHFEDPGTTDNTIKNPQAELSSRLRGRLSRWVPAWGAAPRAEYDLPKAQAIIAEIDRAFALLEKKKASARVDSARCYLADLRAPVAGVIALVESLGADFDGPLGIELTSRLRSTRLAYRAAMAAREVATRGNIKEAMLEVEASLADLRQLDRDIDSVNAGLIRLVLPESSAFLEAKNQTRALERAHRVTVHDIKTAIDQGLAAPPLSAALFVAFESEPAHELVAWRTRAIEEHQAGKQAVAAE